MSVMCKEGGGQQIKNFTKQCNLFHDKKLSKLFVGKQQAWEGVERRLGW